MSLSAEARKKLEFLNHQLRTTGKHSHHNPPDYAKPIKIFIDEYKAGNKVEPNEVEEWASTNGWSDEHARDLREMALTVNHTLDIVGV